MGQITTDQSHAVIAALIENIDWSQLDFRQAGLQDSVLRNKKQAGAEFLRFLQNGARVQTIGAHVIDCDADPFIPNGLTIESHKKGGQVHWNPANFKLWLHPEQESGGIGGHNLRMWLKNKPVYNACMLDYWLAHPEIIPAECKGKWTYFWDTIYRGSRGGLCVRCLDWYGLHPVSVYDWLVLDWSAHYPAAGSAK